jgi:hypothetical protein
MTTRRYAQQTSVAVSKTKGEVEDLLRKWGASQMGWHDDFDSGKVFLRFMWYHDEAPFMARFTFELASKAVLMEKACDQRNGQFSQPKFDKLLKRRGMVEHRGLLLFLKAVFNAVDLGIITAEQVFLPYLEDGQGRTVADLVVPQLAKALRPGGAFRLLETKNG